MKSKRFKLEAYRKATPGSRRYELKVGYEVIESETSLAENCPAFVAKMAAVLLTFAQPTSYPPWDWLSLLVFATIFACLIAAVAGKAVAFEAKATEASDE